MQNAATCGAAGRPLTARRNAFVKATLATFDRKLADVAREAGVRVFGDAE
jgi:hypothetical protein